MIPTDFSTRLGVQAPIVQAPMAGAGGLALALAASQGGAVASLPCAMLDFQAASDAISSFKAHTDKPLNLNFFCHAVVTPDHATLASWQTRLQPYYAEYGVEAPEFPTTLSRKPFDAEQCKLVEQFRPEVVSFHFGLPPADLLRRVQASGAQVWSSATTVAEARWLADQGCDMIIAQGFEAGGHRGVFLDEDITTQMGTLALVPQVVDAVDVPVIAAGGIADGRGVAAAFALGACAVQIGTAFLKTPQATISAPHLSALEDVRAENTALTNLFSGRPARGIKNRIMEELGPMSVAAPPFPWAGAALAPLKDVQDGAFVSLWSGQAAQLAQPTDAAVLVGELVNQARKVFAELAD